MWHPGMFCMFTADPKIHPMKPQYQHEYRKVGKIKDIIPIGYEDGAFKSLIKVEDSWGVWDVSSNDGIPQNLSGISGVHPDIMAKLHPQDREFFFHKPEYFKSLLQPIIPSYVTYSNSHKYAKLLSQPREDAIYSERALVTALIRLQKLFDYFMYNYPETVILPDDDFLHADQKQGCFYATKDRIDDVIYQFKINNCDWKNHIRDNTYDKKEPRVQLAEDRIEELRIAIFMMHDNISHWICNGVSGDEEKVEEYDYLEKIKEVKRILENAKTI